MPTEYSAEQMKFWFLAMLCFGFALLFMLSAGEGED